MIPGSAAPLLLGQTSGGGDFSIDRSLRFNSGDSAYLNFTPSAAGNRKTWTWSGWFKNSVSGAANQRIFSAKSGSSQTEINFDSNGRLFLYEGPTDCYVYTQANLRDPSAWYHFVVVYNTTQGSMSDRVKIYVNGALQSTTQTGSDIPQNTEGSINNTYDHRIGSYATVGSPYLDACLAEVNFIDGQALAPTDFGEFDANGVWQAKEVNITSPNDGTVWSDSLVSSTSNFYVGAQGVQEGFDNSTATYVQQVGGVNPNYITFTPTGGIAHTSKVEIYINNTANEVSYNNGSLQSISSGWNTIATGSGTLTSIRVERPSTSGASFHAIRVDGVILVDGAGTYGTNGFRLPFTDNSTTQALGYDQKETVTLNPKGGMDVVTYSGTGSARSISDLAFQPDFVWIKVRDHTYYHYLWDSVRGATKELNSNTNSAEYTDTAGLTSFSSNGFGLGSGAGANQSGKTYVAWCWKAGGAASSNTSGTLASSVSADTTYGFSVGTYTGSYSSQPTSLDTVGHGLGAAPAFIISKSKSGTSNWHVWHSALANNEYIRLNSSDAKSNSFHWRWRINSDSTYLNCFSYLLHWGK